MLKFASHVLVVSITFLLGHAHAESCKYFGNSVNVVGWHGVLPHRVVLYRYGKGGGFIDPIQISSKFNLHIFSPLENTAPTLIIRFAGYEAHGLFYDADYKLVVDDQYVYEISEIEPSEPRWGCLLYGGKANECRLYEGIAGLGFNSKCAAVLQ